MIELGLEEREAILRMVRDVQAAGRTMDWGDGEEAGSFAAVLTRSSEEVCRVEDAWLPDAITRCYETWVGMGRP